MTTTIIETVAVTGTTFAFTTVLDRDVGALGVRLVDDGTGLVECTVAGWTNQASAGTEVFFWNALTAGETSHTLSVVHSGGTPQLVAMLLRSDLPYGDPSGLADLDVGAFGFSFSSIVADSAYVAWSMVRDGDIAMTGTWTLLGGTGLVNGYAHNPLQVPSGTTIAGGGYFNTLRYAQGFDPWAGASPVTPAAAAGWGVWIVD
jgi:hypothetical protein